MGKSKLAQKISNNAPVKFDPATLGRPPIGMMWVYNRLSKPYFIIFDANEELWGPHECRMVHKDLAKHCVGKSLYKFDPLGLNNVMVLVDQEDKQFGVPLPKHLEEKGDELLIRDGNISPKDVETIKIEQ